MKKRYLGLALFASIGLFLAACEGPQGQAGKDGVSVVSIERTSYQDNVDTYTITYSDGSTSTFTITNGTAGAQGVQGEPGKDGHTPVITIGTNGHWFIDGVDTGINATGPSGEQIVSITSVEKTGTDGLVDTYTIYYSDGHTSIFTVTNGATGEQGIQGQPGADGHTPVINIGPNGNWFVDGVDTGVHAQGPQGPQGVSVVSIVKTGSDGLVDTYTITYSNGTTSTFTVTNGTAGAQGIQGQPGADGHTPSITIGVNGNWFVDGIDTGVPSQAPAIYVVSITKTGTEGLVDTYTILFSDGTTSTFTVTNGAPGNSPYVGENGNWWVGDFDTGVVAGEDRTEPEYTLEQFQEAVDHSEPTKIVTNQTFKLDEDESSDEDDLILHYNSNLTIEYGGEVKTKYEYTYEKINEIVTGNESFLTMVSNTLYSRGTGVYDGVQWVNQVDGATTMSGVTLSEASNIVTDHNTLTANVEKSKIRAFFGANYNIKDLSLTICLSHYKIASVKLTFKAHIDCIDEDAEVSSYTTFSYDKLTVNIPY